MKRVRHFITAALCLSLVGLSRVHSTVQVDGMLTQFVGTWKGGVIKADGSAPVTQDVMRIQPMMSNKFLQIDLRRKSMQPQQDNFQGKGVLTDDSDQGKYFLYWFDTDGAHRQYEGKVEGNTIHLAAAESADRPTLLLSIQNGDQLTVTVGRGNTVVQRIAYTKVH